MKPIDFYNYQKDNHLTQVEMAKKIGVAPVTYSDYIARKPKTRAMKEYARNKFVNFYNKYINKAPLEEILQHDLLKDTTVASKLTSKTEAVYLDSAEELISELVAGNIVYVADEATKTFKMIDGMIVCCINEKPISVNPVILCSDKYYVIKEIPLRLNVGKRYAAKDGSTVTIFNTDGQNFHGVVDGKNGFISFQSDGKSFVSADFDLIEEI